MPLTTDIHRVEVAFGGGRQQGQRAADLGLHQLRQFVADHDLRGRRLGPGGSPATKAQLRPAQAEIDLRSTPLPTKTADLSPLEIRPENCMRGATARTPGCAA
jgi:hypothetical protein